MTATKGCIRQAQTAELVRWSFLAMFYHGFYRQHLVHDLDLVRDHVACHDHLNHVHLVACPLQSVYSLCRALCLGLGYYGTCSWSSAWMALQRRNSEAQEVREALYTFRNMDHHTE